MNDSFVWLCSPNCNLLPKNHLSVDVETLRIYEIPLHVKNKRFGLQYHGGNFCVEAVSEAIKRFGTLEIFNTDLGYSVHE